MIAVEAIALSAAQPRAGAGHFGAQDGWLSNCQVMRRAAANARQNPMTACSPPHGASLLARNQEHRKLRQLIGQLVLALGS